MYAPGERDLLVMYHEVEAQFPHGKEVYVVPLHARVLSDRLQLLLHHVVLRHPPRRHCYGHHGIGTPRFLPAHHVTCCAQVGVPAAIATQLMLDGRVAARGVVRPMDPAVYEPMLELLEAEGIVMHEKRIA